MSGYKALPTGAAGRFQEPPYESLRGAGTSAALDGAVENKAILIDGAP